MNPIDSQTPAPEPILEQSQPIVVGSQSFPQSPDMPVEPSSIMQPKKQNKFIAPVILIIVGLFLTAVLAVGIRAVSIPANYKDTTGTITAVQLLPKGGPSLTIQFKVNDAPYTFSTTFNTESSDTVGVSIPIAYDSSRPDHNPKIDRTNPLQSHTVDMTVYAIGGLLMFGGIALLIKSLLS